MFLETPSFLHRSRTFRPSARQCSIASLCLISGAKLGNHCKVMPVYALLCAAIPDFRGYTWESLQGYARLRPLACSDSGFQGGNLGIAARLLSVYALLRAAIPDFRGSIWESLQGLSPAQKNGPPAAQSSWRWRMARLQHSRGVQAGTGCHEGGIILRKKPPEWHLSLPQRHAASGSNLSLPQQRYASDSNPAQFIG